MVARMQRRARTVADEVSAHGVTVRFGSLVALSEVDLRLAKGDLLGLIGPNGAGKTTMVNVLSGFQRPTDGKVMLKNQDMTGARAEVLARRGLTRTFQSTRIFSQLTVLENVEAGAVGCGAGRRRARAQARALVDRMGFADRASNVAATLSHGHRRLVGMLRALATEPTLLLLDEPAAGLDENESHELVDFIRRVRDEFGCGIMVIEHDMSVIMPLCERIHVLDYGRSIAEDTAAAIRKDPRVIQAYLGTTKASVAADDQ
jgi:branched-chain amino acid transport system ATP-binding protein